MEERRWSNKLMWISDSSGSGQVEKAKEVVEALIKALAGISGGGESLRSEEP